MTALFYFHSSAESQRVRLALAYKQIPFDARALAYDDDETFFELGIARQAPVLQFDDGRLLTDSFEILRTLDDGFPARPIYRGIVSDDAWTALKRWREEADTLFQRLYAPALPAYEDIGRAPEILAAYQSAAHARFGMTLEELANDRYAGFDQLVRRTRLPALAQHLARNRFYLGEPSAADMVLAADFAPLQLLDGVALPIDLLYYIERVENECGASLREGLLAA